MATLSQAVTATGVTASVLMKTGAVRVSGTFVGTVQVEVDVIGDGTFAAAVDTTGAAITFTAPGALKIDNGLSCNTRLNCTAYTSGTINVALAG